MPKNKTAGEPSAASSSKPRSNTQKNTISAKATPDLFPKKSVAEIEKEVEELRKNFGGENMPREIARQIDRLRRASALRRRAAKICAAKLETTNNQYLIFVTSGKNLYKLTGHSVLFFRYRVAKLLGVKAHVLFDNDHYGHSKEGTITKRLDEKFIARLEEFDIKKTNDLKNDLPPGDLIVFKLKTPLSDDAIKYMDETSKARALKFERMVMPTQSYPNLYIAICDALNISISVIGRISNEYVRKVIGKNVIDACHAMLINYLDMACRRSDLKEAVLKIKHHIIDAKNNLKCLDVIQSVKRKEELYRIGEKIFEIEKITTQLLAYLVKERKATKKKEIPRQDAF